MKLRRKLFSQEDEKRIKEVFENTLKEPEFIADGGKTELGNKLQTLRGALEFKTDEYGTFTVELSGGWNGSGKWSHYFNILGKFIKRLEESGVDAWMIKAKNDCCDDVFYFTLGLKLIKKEK